ncbi:hypothetical protein [Gordonia sp. (in: high G+C Gram-positive bacteria)]|uniref:hypothetical protein n=1 Tax=Gordonia sp. (in: high G+C Gram-positive bacteria) TaxID=84139 RepID=UPI002636D3DC|nr:hypothetical protein [Gordonia sp. (in: high G+C Gram-positive bacteria)]
MTDSLMSAITAAVTAGRDGDTDHARAALLAIWNRTPTPEAGYRCVLAHYLADLYDHPAEALIWDTRALDTAHDLTDAELSSILPGGTVAALRPSLHLNLADQLRRLGAFDGAAEHVAAARTHLSALAADSYGEWIRALGEQVAAAVAARDSAPLRSSADPTAASSVAPERATPGPAGGPP